MKKWPRWRVWNMADCAKLFPLSFTESLRAGRQRSFKTCVSVGIRRRALPDEDLILPCLRRFLSHNRRLQPWSARAWIIHSSAEASPPAHPLIRTPSGLQDSCFSVSDAAGRSWRLRTLRARNLQPASARYFQENTGICVSRTAIFRKP